MLGAVVGELLLAHVEGDSLGVEVALAHGQLGVSRDALGFDPQPIGDIVGMA